MSRVPLPAVQQARTILNAMKSYARTHRPSRLFAEILATNSAAMPSNTSRILGRIIDGLTRKQFPPREAALFASVAPILYASALPRAPPRRPIMPGGGRLGFRGMTPALRRMTSFRRRV